MELGTNLDLAFTSVGHDKCLADSALWERSLATTLTLSHSTTEAQDSCLQIPGEPLELSQGYLNSLAFLQENLLKDCHLRTQQTLRRHIRNYAISCVPCWDKEYKTLHRSFLSS